MKGSTKEIFAASLQALIDAPASTWTASKLARELDVNRSTVSMWLKGSKFPRPDQLDALAKIFGIPVMRFFMDPSDDRSVMTPEAALEVLQEIVRTKRNLKP